MSALFTDVFYSFCWWGDGEVDVADLYPSCGGPGVGGRQAFRIKANSDSINLFYWDDFGPPGSSIVYFSFVRVEVDSLVGRGLFDRCFGSSHAFVAYFSD